MDQGSFLGDFEERVSGEAQAVRTEKRRGWIKGSSGLAMWLPFTELEHISKGLKLLGSIFWSPGPSLLDTALERPSTDYPGLPSHRVPSCASRIFRSAVPGVCGPEPAQERCSEEVSCSPPLFPCVDPEQPIRPK